jgi:DUF971 family protein
MISLKHVAIVGEELALAWSDGAESFLKLDLLRRGCPCASCQGEPDALGRVVRPEVDHDGRSFILLRFEQVGGYAMQFHWADGHNTGIYSFEYLRSMGDNP